MLGNPDMSVNTKTLPQNRDADPYTKFRHRKEARHFPGNREIKKATTMHLSPPPVTSNKGAVKAVNQLFFLCCPTLHFPSGQTRITGNYRRTGEKKCCLMYTYTVRCIHTCLVSPGERYMILFSVKHVISEPFSLKRKKNFTKKFSTRHIFLSLIGMAYVWQHIIKKEILLWQIKCLRRP